MASNRHLGRIVALQTLYEYDFRISSTDQSVELDEILVRNVSRYKETIDDKTFIANYTVVMSNLAVVFSQQPAPERFPATG